MKSIIHDSIDKSDLYMISESFYNKYDKLVSDDFDLLVVIYVYLYLKYHSLESGNDDLDILKGDYYNSKLYELLITNKKNKLLAYTIDRLLIYNELILSNKNIYIDDFIYEFYNDLVV